MTHETKVQKTNRVHPGTSRYLTNKLSLMFMYWVKYVSFCASTLSDRACICRNLKPPAKLLPRADGTPKASPKSTAKPSGSKRPKAKSKAKAKAKAKNSEPVD